MKQESGIASGTPALLDATLEHLRTLVSFDTRNPPRTIGRGGIFEHIRLLLDGFDVRVIDHGAGAISMYAVRGRPRLLFNVHLDTVPDSKGWTADPFTLEVDGERAVGLGACDIKGAAAALLAVATAGDGDMALLFTSDEEANDARCVASFLDSHQTRRIPDPRFRDRAFDAVIVAEPTRCKAVLAHRGIQSVRVRFRGHAGHASGEQDAGSSALHQAVRWGDAALDFVAAQSKEVFSGLRGLRFNIGRIEGGIKANMIAPDAELRFGMRPLPSMDPDTLLHSLYGLVEPAPAEFEETFCGLPLPACDVDVAEPRRLAAQIIAESLGMQVGGAVDFWTEAALFSQAGYPAIVFGPGDIAQAHTADEWVALAQLRDYVQTMWRIVQGTRG